MKNFFALILILIFINACDKKDQCSNPETNATSEDQAQCTTPTTDTPPVVTEPDPETPPVATDPEAPNEEPEEPGEEFIFSTNVKFTNFEEADKQKVYKALEIIKKVVQSQEFKDRILNYTYKGEKAFIDNNGLTNEDILQSIYDASEHLAPGTDHEMDVNLQLYYKRFTSTIGYTTPDTLTIYMNTKYFYGFSALDVAGNIFHEWLHKIGYDHDFNYSESRDHSVPYAIGYLIEELGKKYE